LTDIAGGLQFSWVWQSAKGHSGGIVMGVREEFLEIEDHEIGEYFISLVVRQRTTNFIWVLMTVYGLAQLELSRDFIAKLSRKCMTISLPIVMGGDFNLIRQTCEKSNGHINQGLMDKFNMFIDLHQLQEIRSGPKFTWTNKQLHPIMVTLDMILISTQWEARFLICFTWSSTRVRFDQWPIFLNFGEGSLEKQNCFYFEKQWLFEKDFVHIFSDNWTKCEKEVSSRGYSLDRWRGCLCLTRRFLRGWNENTSMSIKREKKTF
jgi:hypothetical protein